MTVEELKKGIVSSDLKYAGAYNYIHQNKPKFIVEYGGGKSTFYLTELVNYLNYGGKVVGYESSPEWYQDHIDNGWNKHNNIFLVDVDHFSYLGKFHVIRYLHPIQDIIDTDFMIIDGPDLTLYDPYPVSTINLLDLVQHTGREIPYFIDGRTSTKTFYRTRLKENLEVEDTKITT